MFEMISMTRILIICFLSTVITAGSCNKQENVQCSNGYIYWGGSPAADGLGWYFAESRSGNWKAKQLKEEELPAHLRSTTDSTAVFICLEETTERAPCFCATPSYYYKVVSAQKR
jgi:hypothetical protein